MKRRFQVGVIGNGTATPDSQSFRLGQQLGRALIDAGHRLVTGGLGGVMEAACKGARSSGRHRSGDIIAILPGRDPGVANKFVDIAIPTGLDHARNSIVAQSDALVAIGGAAGTLSEICFGWIYRRLIIAVGDGGWAGKVAGAPLDHGKRFPGTIPEDQIYAAATVQEAIHLLKGLLPLYTTQMTRRKWPTRRKGVR
jgi:uncharacterized protein (TIGR00725 family)